MTFVYALIWQKPETPLKVTEISNHRDKATDK